MDEEMLELIWTNHGPIFRYWFTEHREKERYTDAHIGCEGRLYAVHKLVLATCSNYFDEVFEHTEGKHPVILLHDVKQHELEAILCYMYTGSASISQLNLSRFMKVAKALQIKGLAVPDGDSNDPLVAVENHQIDSNKSSSSSYCWQGSERGSMQSMSDSSELHEDMEDAHPGASGGRKKECLENKKSENKDQYSFHGFKYKSVEGVNDGDLIKKREVLEKIISQTEKHFIKDEKREITPDKAAVVQEASPVSIKSEPDDEYIDEKKSPRKEKLSSPESGSSKLLKGTMKRNLNGQKKSIINKVKASKLKSIKKHLADSGVKSYKCLQCPASFSRKYALQRHLEKHTEEVVEQFVCTYCHARFTNKEFLTVHMETHDKSKPYVCTICHASFSRKDKLTVHIKNHETEGKGKVIAQVKNFSSKVFVCNECPATFETHSLFVEHSQKHAGERQFPCTVCPAAFAKKVHLSRHFLAHKGFGSKDKFQDIN